MRTAINVELDKLMSEKIMHRPRLAIGQMEPIEGYWDRGTYIEVRRHTGDSHIWSPSTNVQHAWEVVTELREFSLSMDINVVVDKVEVRIMRRRDSGNPTPMIWSGAQYDFPLALCFAVEKYLKWREGGSYASSE